MYGRNACQQLKEFNNREKGQLVDFNDVQTSKNEDHFGALIHHLTLILCKLIWKVGPVILEEIEEKPSHSEEEYLKKHYASLKSYLSRSDLDLVVHLIFFFCQKEPIIKRNDQELVISCDFGINSELQRI
ncbi:hypothetical protein UlMin_007164 [Ulmus minor]